MTVSIRCIRACVCLLVCGLAFGCSKSEDPVVPQNKWPPPDPVTISAPGFLPMPIPRDNPLTKQGIELGRHLFYDPILSADSTEACATCHVFGRGFSDSLRYSLGIDGDIGERNAPQLTNAGWLPFAFWDGRAASLEDQAVQPVANPIEMKSDWNDVVAKLQAHPTYPDMFGRAFGTDQVTQDLVVKAIAQFERTFVSYNSKYDVFIRTGDPVAAGFTPAQQRGLDIFQTERGDCFHCHKLNAFATDHGFHNVGLDSTFFGVDKDGKEIDRGRGEFTGNPDEYLMFKTPTLRNVEVTAPYMHDGRFATLEEVVRHYNAGGFTTSTIDPLLRKRGVGLGLTDQEIGDVVEYLKTYTDPAFINDPDLKNPFE